MPRSSSGDQLGAGRGMLCWGIKRSFRDYVRALPDGAEHTQDGASLQNGSFLFPAEHSGVGSGSASGFGSGTSPDADPGMLGEAQYTGTVRFHGYRGLLAVTIRSPRLRPVASGLELSVADPDARESDVRIVLAAVHGGSCHREGAMLIRRDAIATLAPTAVRVFDDTYPAGTELDPLSFSILIGNHPDPTPLAAWCRP